MGYVADSFVVTNGKVMTLEELGEVQGRPWDDVDVSVHSLYARGC